MGHRYYTEAHIRLFKQIKDLKDKGYQLKAIKTALDKVIEEGRDPVIPDELLEGQVAQELKESAISGTEDGTGLDVHNTAQISIAQEKMEQFQEIMGDLSVVKNRVLFFLPLIDLLDAAPRVFI